MNKAENDARRLMWEIESPHQAVGHQRKGGGLGQRQ
jgi:hypothetical protein